MLRMPLVTDLAAILFLLVFSDGAKVIHMLTEGDFPRLVRATGSLGWKANPGLDPPPCRRVGLRKIDPVR